MGNLISKPIQWAFFLATIGQLKPAILYFATEAARHQQRGLISLSALNHALWDNPRSKAQKQPGRYGKATRPRGALGSGHARKLER